MTTSGANCRVCQSDFTNDSYDLAIRERLNAPPSTLCPTCNFKRRAVFRNERALYNSACALCGKSMISMYHPKSPYTVYCLPCWESDAWDPRSYAKPYDPARPFFEQLGELMLNVPKKCLFQSTGLGHNINSDYTNMAGGNKNCYLIFNSGGCEDTMYSRGLIRCRETVDAYFGSTLERCYETVNVEESAGIVFGQNVAGCLDSAFLLNCNGCTNCFGCVNLRHKSYHFLNEPVSKEEYKKRVEEVMGSYRRMQKFRKEFEAFTLKFPRKENSNFKSTDCAGDYLFNCKNLVSCFEVETSENCRYAFSNKHMKDCSGTVGYGYHSELLLETAAVGVSSRVIGSCFCENCQELEYSYAMKSSKNCFGCDGLKNGQFCILNTQYEEAAYRALREKIVRELKEEGEYGLSMSPALSPFAYNESTAQDNIPLTKEEAVRQGFRWEDELQITQGKETLPASDIPDHIRDVADSILDEILACANCGRNYRIIRPELTFYRKTNLPLPRQCFNCRFMDRIKRRGPFQFFNRTCAKCKKAITTTFAPDLPGIVYCEQCYNAEVA